MHEEPWIRASILRAATDESQRLHEIVSDLCLVDQLGNNLAPYLEVLLIKFIPLTRLNFFLVIRGTFLLFQQHLWYMMYSVKLSVHFKMQLSCQGTS